MRLVSLLASLLALSASAAFAQTTDCRTIGTWTQCRTQPPTSPQSDPSSVIYQQLRDASNGTTYQNAYRATVQAQEQRRAAEAAQAAATQAAQEDRARRRAVAFDRVGELIAAGKCDDAKRLAGFYGVPELVDATERACT